MDEISKSVKDVIENIKSNKTEPSEASVKKMEQSFAQIDAKYIGRAKYLFSLMQSLASLYDDYHQLESMNHKKRGAPFKYTHDLMRALSTLRSALGLDLRTCAGMAETFLGENRKHPHYSQISRRINALKHSIKDGLSDVALTNTTITLIPDGTGLTPATRSEYIRVVHHLKRGFLRLVIIINRDTLEIVAHSLTDDKTGESTVFEKVVEDALINLGVDPEERRTQVREQKNLERKTYRPLALAADGGYDTRKIFSFCKKLGITPNIRVQTNSNAQANGVDRARTEVVLEQLGGPGATPKDLANLSDKEREENRKKWKKTVEYNLRWFVEIVISALKAKYGGAVMSKKMEYIKQEIKQKICLYNQMLRIGKEASMNA